MITDLFDIILTRNKCLCCNSSLPWDSTRNHLHLADGNLTPETRIICASHFSFGFFFWMNAMMEGDRTGRWIVLGESAYREK